MQAAVFGVLARQLLTAEPLDSYVRRGLLSTDPRTTVDGEVDPGRIQITQAMDRERCPAVVRSSTILIELKIILGPGTAKPSMHPRMGGGSGAKRDLNVRESGDVRPRNRESGTV